MTNVASSATIQLCASESFAKKKPVVRSSAEVQHRGRRQEGRVGEAALDDDLDVTQPVSHDGRRERQRHDAQRNRGQLKGERGIHADGPRQRVEHGERSNAEGRSPGDPAKLPLPRLGRNLPERVNEHAEGRHGAHDEIRMLGALHEVDRP